MGMFSSIASFAGGLISNEANRKEGSKNRSFQKDLSSTSHQREIADLKAAGLNPILSAKYGGSSTPPGSMAVMQNPASAAADTSVKDKSATSQVSLQDQLIAESKTSSDKNINNAKLLQSQTHQQDLQNTRTSGINNFLEGSPAFYAALPFNNPAMGSAAMASSELSNFVKPVNSAKPQSNPRSPQRRSSAKQVQNYANPWLNN